ncbi:MAG: nucleotidyltransferase domain-containing protein [Chloroflexota bacterium]|nr:nucleotidyltransferase domain-containing protein [Chloroflexota bacterium]
MAKTVLELTPEELKKYSLRPKRQLNLAQRKRLMARAMRQARRAADLLKREFGASRVVLFGSLAHRLWFTPWSDIDLAVWGIAPGEFYRAAGTVLEMTNDFKIDVVDPETCRPSVRTEIEEDGIDL